MEFVASLCAALFAGAALYINAVEHPARMSCGPESALAEWAMSYHRATWMQVPLAAVGCGCAIGAWAAGSSIWWLIGGVILILVVPFTQLIIMPINKRLASGHSMGGDEKCELLNRWNRLHTVRTALGVSALVIFLTAR